MFRFGDELFLMNNSCLAYLLANNVAEVDPRRCIGCAQCALACDKVKAIEMEAVPGYKELTPLWKE